MAFEPLSLSSHVFEHRSSVLTWFRGRPVLVAQVDGQLYGLDAVCAHMGCALLSEVEGREAVCPAHGARYDLATGSLTQPAVIRPETPCAQEEVRTPLRTYRVRANEKGLLEIDAD
ncbi:MAG: Rieske 2Fe-2S domain-containing protein [Firmicutes bacterium]|nr:Rieske 2Fe-2S domain-containing protein [Bacillota bacterium]